jgi:dihydrofolate reductase
MRRIVVSEFLSVDGVMEDPGGAEGYAHGGWTFQYDDPERNEYKLREVLDHDALLLGRVTYQGFAKAWPSMADPVGFADKMNSMPKYVVSSTLTQLDWNNSSLVDPDAIAALREQDEGGDILVAGSATLVQWLHAQGLIDEYRLMVFPIVLGSGKRLFGHAEAAIRLNLVDEQRYPSGTAVYTYHRAG